MVWTMNQLCTCGEGGRLPLESTSCKLIAGTNTRQLRAGGDLLITEFLSTPSTTGRTRRRFHDEVLGKKLQAIRSSYGLRVITRYKLSSAYLSSIWNIAPPVTIL